MELLERSLGYTRVALAGIGQDDLDAPTPCSGWTLSRLLEHMEDALDAFTEAASGQVEVTPASPRADRVDSLREKACTLLGVWTEARTGSVAVGDRQLDAPLLVEMAALEIAVHGWDVAQATGRRTPIPDDLARGLQLVAARVVRPADRGSRFGPARRPAAPASPTDALMAFLGRMTGPVGGNSGEPPSPEGIAS
ncbi:TIGR03086 family metal-binding protein [Nocardioides sp.]|uniref:TIGR03086 family metal-binding protein n=1 Tax=Nocardioides sp. TaxID=35761 RepID=UPI001A1AD6F0|nr:TIGR03086 family metal-binding protein [Nocardioides sp.]MBJ7357196.1 TIGR03086 family protein [Nocardioides sp.]